MHNDTPFQPPDLVDTFARMAWDDLRSRLPMTLDDAYQCLEAHSETLAEFGSGWVCGGGMPSDVSAAYFQFGQTEGQRDAVAEANALVDLHLPWRVPEFFPAGYRAPEDDDLPF